MQVLFVKAYMPKYRRTTPLGMQVACVAFGALCFCASIATVITGNMWVNADTIAREFFKHYGQRVRVVYVERHVWQGSRVVLEDASGQKTLYEIDSDLLFRYSFDRKD